MKILIGNIDFLLKEKKELYKMVCRSIRVINSLYVKVAIDFLCGEPFWKFCNNVTKIDKNIL
jgi:hypothetical protein